MFRVTFTTWEIGMRGIPFIKLLHKKGGLSLHDAMHSKNELLDGIAFSLIVCDEELASEILEEATRLGVKGVLEPVKN